MLGMGEMVFPREEHTKGYSTPADRVRQHNTVPLCRLSRLYLGICVYPCIYTCKHVAMMNEKGNGFVKNHGMVTVWREEGKEK